MHTVQMFIVTTHIMYMGYREPVSLSLTVVRYGRWWLQFRVL